MIKKSIFIALMLLSVNVNSDSLTDLNVEYYELHTKVKKHLADSLRDAYADDRLEEGEYRRLIIENGLEARRVSADSELSGECKRFLLKVNRTTGWVLRDGDNYYRQMRRALYGIDEDAQSEDVIPGIFSLSRQLIKVRKDLGRIRTRTLRKIERLSRPRNREINCPELY